MQHCIHINPRHGSQTSHVQFPSYVYYIGPGWACLVTPPCALLSHSNAGAIIRQFYTLQWPVWKEEEQEKMVKATSYSLKSLKHFMAPAKFHLKR
jgi:hypothetical protein